MFSMKSIQYFFLVFAIVLVLFATLAFVLRWYNVQNNPEKFPAYGSVKGEDFVILPQVLNRPTESIRVGERFLYIPNFVHAKDEVFLELRSSPGWLNLKDGIIWGVPDSVGSFSFVLRISTVDGYYDEVFYLIVNDQEDE